jgi:hypothetical protein
VKSFVHIAVSRAIYATGWDGAVTLEADVHGHWTVLNDQVNGPPGPVSGAGATALLNINTATADQLSTLPMIGLNARATWWSSARSMDPSRPSTTSSGCRASGRARSRPFGRSSA